jgi:hypothetical protein
MPRDFFGYRTVTDLLINKGVGFHPETVIIEVDDIDPAKPPIKYSDSITGPSRPCFDYQVIEQVKPHMGIKVGRAIYVKWLAETRHVLFRSFLLINDIIACSPSWMVLNFDLTGEPEKERKELAMSDANMELVLPGIAKPIMTPEEQRSDAVFTLMVFNMIHEKYEIEEVEFTRQVRRQAERKTGKKPSNHYSLRTIKHVRKQYPASDKNNTPAAKPSREAHLVRGHFLTQPDNHPLAQFAGKTFWVPAHNRGAGTNEKKIIYRVEL